MIEFNEDEIKACAYKNNLADVDLFVAGARHQYQLDVWEYKKLLQKYDQAKEHMDVYKKALNEMLVAREKRVQS